MSLNHHKPTLVLGYSYFYDHLSYWAPAWHLEERAEDPPELPWLLLATAKSGAVQKFRDHLNLHGTRLVSLSLGKTPGISRATKPFGAWLLRICFFFP